jgi:glycosyltransferase involved in cell wall biosynthesis
MNTTNHPLISVVMPVYNGDRYLGEAIRSILDQTMMSFEFIIINDGSSDTSPAIIKDFESVDKRIKTITNPLPLGKAGDLAKEMGIKNSHGKYIAIMDADDIAKPNRLKTQFDFLEAHPEIFLCGSFAEYIDKNKTVFLEWKPDTSHEKIVRNLYYKNSIIHPTFFFRNLPGNSDFYATKYNWYNDYYTQFKLIREGKKLANVPEILLSYRVSGNSSTQTGIRKKVLEYFDIRREIAEYGPCKPGLISRLKVLAQYLAIRFLPERLVLRFHPVFKKTL